MQIAVTETKHWLSSPLRYGKDSNGDIWFVLKDICDALHIKNPSQMKWRLKQDHNIALRQGEVQNSRGQMRETTLVLEDVVYSVIVPKSRKPEAIKFHRWVGNVIKTIRKTGSYSISPQLALESKRVDLQIVELAREMFPNDARMSFLCGEKLASLMSNKLVLGGPKLPATVTELLEKKGLPPKDVLKYRIGAGRYVAKKYREKFGEPETTYKLCQGHNCKVKVYPEEHSDMLSHWLDQYISESD